MADNHSPAGGTPGPDGGPGRIAEPRVGDGPERVGAGWEGVLREALGGLLGGGKDAGTGGPSADDVADVLWVAGLAGLGGGVGEDGEPARDGRAEERGVPPPRAAADARERPTREGAEEPVPPDDGPGPAPAAAGPAQGDAPDPTAARATLHPFGASGPSGAAAHVVQVTQPAALAGALALARALRPLRQSVDSPGPALLDEEATAQTTGEAGRLIPVWRPASERRFSVDLLVDTGATMAVWHRLAAELCTVLERHGAFADVRCWSLGTDGEVPLLAPFRRRHGGAQRPVRARGTRWSRPLEDPTGRAVLLVLTDGVGPAWYGTSLPDFLGRVAGERPAAVLQVLPRRMWHRTALRTAPVELRVPDPARPVAEVRTQAAVPGQPRGERPAGVRWLPVMEVEGAWLAPWAGLVAGRVPGWSPMLATPVRGVPRPRRSAAGSAGRTEPPDAVGRVARLRSGVSPDAFRLACHLAAAPLSLPVMRLVQQATMPWSGQTDLAELFLSGVIERRGSLPPEPGSAPGPGPSVDPDDVVYDFVPGVREHLLDELTRTESLHILDDVLAKVSGRVAATFGGTLDFRALAALADAAEALPTEDGTPGRLLPAASLPFAEVAVAVLSGAGGQHRSLARRLAAAAEGRVWRPDTKPAAPAAPRPSPPRLDLLFPVRPVTSPPDPERMIGRTWELDLLEEALRPPRAPHAKPSVVIVQAIPGMGRNRLLQEYLRQNGDRHTFVHRIDCGTSESYRLGLEALRAALAREEDPPSLHPWGMLSRHSGWLVVCADVPTYETSPLAAPYLPWASDGWGSVIVLTDRIRDDREVDADAVIVRLHALRRDEVVAHLRAVLPDLSATDDQLALVADQLPATPAELAHVVATNDIAALIPRDAPEEPPTAQSPETRPSPLFTWRQAKGDRGLAGYVSDGRVWLAAAGYGQPVRLWDSVGGPAEGAPLPGGPIPARTLAVLPGQDGMPRAAVAGVGGAVGLWDLTTRMRQLSLVVSENAHLSAMTSFVEEDGRRVLVTVNGEVRFWDPVTGDRLERGFTAQAGRVRALAFFVDPHADAGVRGRQLAVVVDDDRSVHVRDASTGADVEHPLTWRLESAASLATVRLRTRYDLVAAIGRDRVVELWDTATGELAHTLDTGASGRLVAVTAFEGPDGAALLATAAADGTAQVWDIDALLPAPDRSGSPVTLLHAEFPGLFFAAWLVAELGAHPRFRDALDLLLPADLAPAITRMLEHGLLVQEGPGQLVVAPEWQTELLTVTTPVRRACESRLLKILDGACPQPTESPDTWRPYTALGGVLRGLENGLASPSALYGGDPADSRLVMEHISRWAEYHLLRGDAEEAERLALLGEEWAQGTGSRHPWFPRPPRERDRLAVVSMRARMARGQVHEAHARARHLLAEETDTPTRLAALLTRAELTMCEGDFVAAKSALDNAEEISGHGDIERRATRYLSTRLGLLRGDLPGAERALRQESVAIDQLTASRPIGVAETAAELMVSLRHASMIAGLGLVRDELNAARKLSEPPATSVTLTVLHAARQRLTLGNDSGRLADLARTASHERFELYVSLTELLVEALVLEEAGALWGRPPGAQRSTPARARMLLEELRPYREPLHSSRPQAYARFKAVEARALIADARFAQGVAAVRAAETYLADLYGPDCPLLPRLQLLKAFAYQQNQSPATARTTVVAECLAEAEAHLTPTSHPDRVTLLLARSQVTDGRRERNAALREADAMAASLLTPIRGNP
ncbi:SAV_2336 N-terminal domain-related protein [Streptomyces sp. NPDC051976]|uniref:SAV_2336 N-terminal domain-related protein n=1 Tax=Streptomyces sp. NPDC051976 TaxID=3154947 RepID=UPI0034236A62